jgi:hypothetical protein
MNFGPQMIVVGDIAANRLEAANRMQVIAPERQSGAEAELGDANQWRHQRARRKVRHHAQGFETARQARRLGAV